MIEDAAQALGARLGAASVGLQGDIGFYSLAVGKGLSIYEGGVLTARDAPLRRALQETSRRLIPDSRMMEARRITELIGYALLYRPGRPAVELWRATASGAGARGLERCGRR